MATKLPLSLAFVLVSCLAVAQADNPVPTPASAPDPASPASTDVAKQPSPQPALNLKADASGALSQDQMRELFRTVADKDIENDKKQRDYTYIARRRPQTGWQGQGEVDRT